MTSACVPIFTDRPTVPVGPEKKQNCLNQIGQFPASPSYGPQRYKTYLRGFRQSEAQTSLDYIAFACGKFRLNDD